MVLAKAETGAAEEQPARKYTSVQRSIPLEKARHIVLAFVVLCILWSTQCLKKPKSPGGNKKKRRQTLLVKPEQKTNFTIRNVLYSTEKVQAKTL